MKKQLLLALLLFSQLYNIYAEEDKKKCLLVMSYHQGYEWNDGIEKGVVNTLYNVCELKIVYMDTKRNPSTEFGQESALKAKSTIEEFKPDVVIASDDNASLYLIEPYYKNSKIPVVFCGINWSAKEYGYPYINATGMVEVAPIVPLLKIVLLSRPYLKKGIYLSSDVVSEHKDFNRYKHEYKKRGVRLTPVFVSSLIEWKREYKMAQKADFIILNNYSGINDWNQGEAIKFVKNNSKVLTVTNYQWMMPYSMLGMTKSAEEQGNWAGQVAKSIIEGIPVNEIPITINKTWSLFVNTELLDSAGVKLSNSVMSRAYRKW
ncbi:hypothetical protein MNBD_GAMMA21-1778 [hydrothermal vent metagenome]|uniref:ABC transporter substrate-binding protein n=1 Tax=hydrothermal vent metagenome TaxID=652676 RepID=A0A3B0ZBE0_9ZZZZ